MTTHFLEPTDVTVSCHVRTALVLEPVDAKIETLRACDADGDVGELLLRSWPAEVGLDSEGPYHEVTDRFREFERWADESGVSVRPPFAIREKTSLAADEPRRVLVTPTFCLGLYHQGQLIGVYPHSEGETTVTATEAVAALRTGELPPLLGDASEPPAVARFEEDSPADGDDRSETGAATGAVGETTRSDGATAAGNAVETPADPSIRDRSPSTAAIACPDCGGGLTNVQGILACVDCDWTDTSLHAVDSPRAKLVYLALLDEPVSIEALTRAVDMTKLALYGILQTLSERDLVEEVAPGTYRARRGATRDEREHAAGETPPFTE